MVSVSANIAFMDADVWGWVSFSEGGIWLAALVLLGCLACVVLSADLIVANSAKVADGVGIPPLLVGLTVVALGTSAPELFVSIQAVIDNANGIALGNIVGSNIANILFVLGIAAVFRPLEIIEAGAQRNSAFLMIVTAVFSLQAYLGGQIGTFTGCAYLIILVGYLTYLGWLSTHGVADSFVDELTDDHDPVSPPNWVRPILVAVGGLGILLISSHVLVGSAVALAESMGVRDEVIGLSLIAFGTSVPELAAVAMAAIRGQSSIALGGILGSNLFNILGVAGAAGVFGHLTFSQTMLRGDVPVLLLATLALVSLVLARKRMGRILGIVSVLSYISYMVWIL